MAAAAADDVLCIILTINCFKVYDIVYMLAGGSNGVVSSSAMVLVYHIYEEAFRNWNLGYASAVAMVLFPDGPCHHADPVPW